MEGAGALTLWVPPAADEEDYFSKEDDDDEDMGGAGAPGAGPAAARVGNGVGGGAHAPLAGGVTGTFSLSSLVDYDDDDDETDGEPGAANPGLQPGAPCAGLSGAWKLHVRSCCPVPLVVACLQCATSCTCIAYPSCCCDGEGWACMQ